MTKLSKKDVAERDEISKKLREEYDALDTAISDFNERVGKLWDELVVPVHDKLNETIQEAVSFAENIATEFESYIDERSDKWQEGERGQAFIAMRDDWQNADLEAVELDTPEAVELPEFDPDTLDNLPEEVAV